MTSPRARKKTNPKERKSPIARVRSKPGIASAGAEDDRPKAKADTGAGKEPSSWRVLLGLTVIWAVLYMIAWAENISINEIKVQAPLTSDARSLAVAPVEMIRFNRTSPRQIVDLLFQNAHIQVSPEDLELISDELTDLRLSERPLHDAIRVILDDPKVGFALRGREAHFFDQKLSEDLTRGGRPTLVSWEAEIELTSEPMVVYPSTRSDLWAMFRLMPSGGGSSPAALSIAAEVWQGDRILVADQLPLGEDGTAKMNFSGGRTVNVSLRLVPNSSGEVPSDGAVTFKIRVFFQEHG